MARSASRCLGFTLVEMLVAMAITLVMMAAVVTLFANVSKSVSHSRANMEMNGQIRQVRNTLQQDLQGATCPGLTWTRPESNVGYIELIEGRYREGNATNLIDEDPSVRANPPSPVNPEIDHAMSTLPSSNIQFKDSSWATDGVGLGDYDDILLLTVRNEQKPFVGRMPSNAVNSNGIAQRFRDWGAVNIESSLAEVIWFAMENPGYTDPARGDDPSAKGFFGEPGMRTIYRRTLLIAPWLNPYRRVNQQTGQVLDAFTHDGQTFKAEPGLFRVLPKSYTIEEVPIECLVSFQDRYDLSAHLAWDPNIVRWKILANTLGDLTKRENRYYHYGFFYCPTRKSSRRRFPFPMVSRSHVLGTTTGQIPLLFFVDPEIGKPSKDAQGLAYVANKEIAAYSIDAPSNYTDPSRRYSTRPFVILDKEIYFGDDAFLIYPPTIQAVLNDDGAVVRLVHGPVPLWGARRGEDVMLTDALAFDVRVFDPGAPVFRHTPTDTTLVPSDPGWRVAYSHNDNTASGASLIGKNNSNSNVEYSYVGQGAYVDLGYGEGMPAPAFAPSFASSALPWFFHSGALHDVYMSSRPTSQEYASQLGPGFNVYDTWSFHYEYDGVNEDQYRHNGAYWELAESSTDEATNGLDDPGDYSDAINAARLGVDDVGERETTPPYDRPLRGVQVILRAYERDSRAIRQVRVNQHFMPE